MMNLTTATNPALPAPGAHDAAPAAAAQPAVPGALPFAQWLGLEQLPAPVPLADAAAGQDDAGRAVAAAAAPAVADGADPAAADAAPATQDASQLAAMAAPLMALALPVAAALSAGAPQPAKRADGAASDARVRVTADAGARATADAGGRAAGAPGAAGAVPLPAAEGDAMPLAAGAAAPTPLPAAAPGPQAARADASFQAAVAAPAAATVAAAPAKHDAPAEPGADRSAPILAGASWGVGAAAAPAPQGAPAASVVLAGQPAAWRQSLHEALGERLNLQLTNHAEQAVIRLDPPNLGRVEIAIRHSAGGLEVNISATHGEVLRQLHAVSDGLRNDLAQRQFTEVAVTVAAAPGRAGAAPFGDQQGRGRQSGREPEELAPGLALRDGGAHPDSIFSLTGRE